MFSLQQQHQVNILQQKKIIGMTINGASIYHSLLSSLRPAVVIVEEAAEVLEAQLLAVLGKWVKHLILIGDHLQLKPPVEDYMLAQRYHFDISMMERLINNNLGYCTLGMQNRMRPEFAELLLDIYPDLKSNMQRVGQLQKPNCIEKSMFFWTHEDKETRDCSFSNPKEAERAVQLSLFLLQQGYKPEQITLLAAYQGQVALLRKKVREAENKYPELFGMKDNEKQTSGGKNPATARNKIRHSIIIHTIDLYQGDENDIVIVSLVRSNDNGNIGFLKLLNRRCVAQSRSRCGLYFIGNSKTLQRKCRDWRILIEKMEKESCVSNTISLVCPKHTYVTLKAQSASDITLGTFCSETCGAEMECGEHSCSGKCQPPHGHWYCSATVPFTFPKCLHTTKKECSEPENQLHCKEKCTAIMTCNIHPCIEICGYKHSHSDCQERVTFSFSTCGHQAEKLCSHPETSIRCDADVNFEFPICKHLGKRLCYQDQGQIKCQQDCPRKLQCGHSCSRHCGDPCDTKSSWKTCERIRKVKEKQKLEAERRERETARKEAKDQLDAISKKKMEQKEEPIKLVPVHPRGDSAAEYASVETALKHYTQSSGWSSTVVQIQTLHLRDLQVRFLKRRSDPDFIKDPTKTQLLFLDKNSHEIKHICQNGYRIGWMDGQHGKGVYFSSCLDDKKEQISLHSQCKAILCEVLVGKSKSVEKAGYQMTYTDLKNLNYDSVFVKSRPGIPGDVVVVYHRDQVLPKFLVEFTMVQDSEALKLEQEVLESGKNDVIVQKLTSGRELKLNDPKELQYRYVESQVLRVTTSMEKQLHYKKQEAKSLGIHVVSIDYCINPVLLRRFMAKEIEMGIRYPGKEGEQILAFHGTKRRANNG